MNMFDQAVTAADDSDRMRKVFESKAAGVSREGHMPSAQLLPRTRSG
jgi:hypothetical protein